MPSKSTVPWDYLIVTASNDAQARAYESQLELRQRLGLLPDVRHVMVVADPEGRRVGSGGSTICCLMEVVNRELAAGGQASRLSPSSPRASARDRRDACSTVESVLRQLRILIIHAGGDSRRLPAYGPCGKIFIPVPGRGHPALGCALFDRIAPEFMSLPPGRVGSGQVVMAAGDALILFDPSNVFLNQPGLTALACPDTPEQASKHGVFCAGKDGRVRLYLQKPSPAEQRQYRAVRQGQTLLDIGIMSFDSTMAMTLLRAFGIKPDRTGRLVWPVRMRSEMLSRGVDFFREICCALGEEATLAHHRRQAKDAGSTWSDDGLRRMFSALHRVPFHLQTIPQARFLHFGTTRQLITSGCELREHDEGRDVAQNASEEAPRGGARLLPSRRARENNRPGDGSAGASPYQDRRFHTDSEPLSLNNALRPGCRITGGPAWVEGCRLRAPLKLGGQNVVIGVEATQSLALPANACIDLLKGPTRTRKVAWFVRCYGINDTFKDPVAKGGTFCGRPLLQWLAAVGATPADIWDRSVPSNKRSLWDARVFPAEAEQAGFRNWLWIFDPSQATPEQKRAFLAADRYSAAEIAVLADQDYFFARRHRLRLCTV
jgi:fucokinase